MLTPARWLMPSVPEVPNLLGVKSLEASVSRAATESTSSWRRTGGPSASPLMEKRLMDTGAANALQCAEDLALKSFVAARCTRI